MAKESHRHCNRKGVALLIFCLSALLALAGCGGDDGGAGEEETATVNLTGLPIGNLAPLYLGVDQGFFRDEGIVVKPDLVQSGNEVITSMVSGDSQFGFVGYVPAMVAKSQGIPIKVVANADAGATTSEDEWTKIVVPRESEIRDVQGLAGSTIAVNSLKGVGEVAIKASLEKQGVDPSSIELIEVPFPDMPAVLDRGDVDAIWVVEPFLTQVVAEGARAVDAPLTTLGKDFANGCYVTTDQFLEQDPDVVERFVRAMNRSLDYAQTHPEEARAVIPTFTEIPNAVAQQMLLSQWPSEINVAQLEQLSEYGVKYDVIGEDVDLDQLIWEGASRK